MMERVHGRQGGAPDPTGAPRRGGAWVALAVCATAMLLPAPRSEAADTGPSIAAATAGISSDAAASPSLSTLPPLERVRVVEPPRAVGDVELLDRSGKAFGFSSLLGRPVLVVFGFVSCPDVCPTVMGRVRLLMQAHARELRDTAVVLVSVDGERDTPERMDGFLSLFSPDFIGLTGAPEAVRPFADRFPAVFFNETPDALGNYNVAHSAQVYLLDRRGRVRAEFLNAPIESMARVTRLVVDETP